MNDKRILKADIPENIFPGLFKKKGILLAPKASFCPDRPYKG
jgi:hypothetical protein